MKVGLVQAGGIQMANVYDSVSIVGLRPAHFNQLIGYLDEQKREGWYYGNKKQFLKRHDELVEWIESIRELVNNPDTKIKEKK